MSESVCESEGVCCYIFLPQEASSSREGSSEPQLPLSLCCKSQMHTLRARKAVTHTHTHTHSLTTRTVNSPDSIPP